MSGGKSQTFSSLTHRHGCVHLPLCVCMCVLSTICDSKVLLNMNPILRPMKCEGDSQEGLQL